MSHFLRAIAARIVPVGALALLLWGVILFADGRYTFSFLLPEEGGSAPSMPWTRPAETTQSALNRPETTDAPPSYEVTLPRPASLSVCMSREDVMAYAGPMRFDPYNASTLASMGFDLSYAEYDPDASILARRDNFAALPAVYSYYDGTKQTVKYVRPTEMSAPEARYSYEAWAVPAVQLYMGYVLVDDGVIELIYDTSGQLAATIRTGEYTPAYTRDTDGRPLFSRQTRDEDGALVTLYYHIADGQMILSSYDDEIDGRGVYFDYPPTYGISDNNLMRLAKRQTTVTTHLDGSESAEDATLWAYAYNTSRYLTGYRFTGAWDFREERAAVLNEEGHMYYLGRYGYQAFPTLKNYYYYERYVTEYLLPPLTSGPESIGFYYYDHGLVRARRQVVDWYGITYINTLRVAVDEDVLLTLNGEIFPIPAGYEIEAYSDGIILLSREGKFGYMTHTGQWITQPIYDYAAPFSEGIGVLGFNDGTRLAIDAAGNILIPPGSYTQITSPSSGVLAAWNDEFGHWDLLWKMARG